MIAQRLPEGVTSFREIRTGNYKYVDKTDLVWQIANGRKFNYLSRPRRFGKSILVDTLQCYFEGNKELFDGLKIMQWEKDWIKYPVIRFDMSIAGNTAEEIKSYFDYAFSNYEEQYHITSTKKSSLSVRFTEILKVAHQSTGQPAAVLVDEYDAPLQHSWKTPYHKECTEVYRQVFAVLKSSSTDERFVFITGITKFTQISLFSVLNNLTNLSVLPEYVAVCGITKQEIIEYFHEELVELGEKNKWDKVTTLQKLKGYYDGYHFSGENMTDIFNPYSLICALAQKRIKNFWVASGATTLLSKFVDNIELRIKNFEKCYIDRDILETSDVTGGGAELFLYQSGYLTIKAEDEWSYTLGFPNYEVRKALYSMALPALTARSQMDIQTMQISFYRDMNLGNIQGAMDALKQLIADVPYSNKKLASMDIEERYRLIITSIMYAVGLRPQVEKMISTGRIDIVVEANNYIYVIELKLRNNGGLTAAKQQIINNNYTAPFQAENKKVVALAIELDEMGKGIIDWSVVE